MALPKNNSNRKYPLGLYRMTLASSVSMGKPQKGTSSSSTVSDGPLSNYPMHSTYGCISRLHGRAQQYKRHQNDRTTSSTVYRSEANVMPRPKFGKSPQCRKIQPSGAALLSNKKIDYSRLHCPWMIKTTACRQII